MDSTICFSDDSAITLNHACNLFTLIWVNHKYDFVMTHRKLLTGLISLGSGLVGPSRQGTYRKLTNFETANYIVSLPTIQLDNEDNRKYLHLYLTQLEYSSSKRKY
ncbi:protein of unknown function [Moritella yayanosii]|uniref:Uncharacterized protein n=1 Tax=Moritella yayanosii TaxID=69539 RepID=A0A330LSE3_9GAMM|nr:protein of unknown function [Moritella yayanosii]